MSGWLSALAGGMVGGGSAWQQSARDEELNNQRMALEEARNRAEMSRQSALESIRAANAKAAAQEQHGYRKAENVQEAGLTGERDVARQGLLDAAQGKQNVYTSQRDSEVADRAADASKLDRASREAISAADNATRLKAAGISAGSENRGTLQVRDDGTVIRIVGDKATPVTDTTTGQPMKSSKGLNDATLKEVESYFIEARNPNLLPEQQAAALANGRELLRRGSPEPLPKPNANNIEILRKNAKNTAFISDFDAKFGSGAAGRLLGDELKKGEPVDLTKPPQNKPGGILNDASIPSSMPSTDPYGLNATKNDAAGEQSVREGRLKQQQDSTKRNEDIKALTPEIASGVGQVPAQRLLEKYGGDGSELPQLIREILRNRAKGL